MSSDRVELHLQFSFLDGEGVYGNVSYMRLHGDNVVEWGNLRDPKKREEAFDRREMIEAFIKLVRAYNPDRIAVVHGGEPRYISKETLAGILDLSLDVEDLFIGS